MVLKPAEVLVVNVLVLIQDRGRTHAREAAFLCHPGPGVVGRGLLRVCVCMCAHV
jgi:hypothetical protein